MHSNYFPFSHISESLAKPHVPECRTKLSEHIMYSSFRKEVTRCKCTRLHFQIFRKGALREKSSFFTFQTDFLAHYVRLSVHFCIKEALSVKTSIDRPILFFPPYDWRFNFVRKHAFLFFLRKYDAFARKGWFVFLRRTWTDIRNIVSVW